MSPRLAQLFLAFHVFGVVLWISGLVTLTYLLAAVKNETDAGARSRLAQYARKIGMFPDIGALIAMLFGLHWLFAFKLYKMPYMHIKLTLVVVLIGMHGLLRAKSKKIAQGAETSLPAFVRPLVVALALGIIVIVMLKVPTSS
jgi:protoporphyrinogen IX oxidase